MERLIAGLVIFFAVHLVPARPELRKTLITRLGLVGYQALFAVVSIGSVILIVQGFKSRPFLPLWTPPDWAPHVVFLVMVPVFPLLIAAYLPGASRSVVQHPMLLAVKIWAVAHLIGNGDLASVLLFGAFLAYGVIDLISIKRRNRAKGVVRKAGSVRNDVISVVLGLGLYAAMLLWGHRALIGVSLIG